MDEWKDIARIGSKIVSAGLTNSRFGNISQLLPGGILITRTGSLLDEIDERQVVLVDARRTCTLDGVASCETSVHRAIYMKSNALAIVHTHSPYAVALSILEEGPLNPIDSEGLAMLGQVPVVSGGFGSIELADAASLALKNARACIAKGHGAFCTGRDLIDAFTVASMVEHSAMVKYLVQLGRATKSPLTI